MGLLFFWGISKCIWGFFFINIKFQLSSSQKIILVKKRFYAHYAIGNKVFFYPTVAFFFISKKVAQCALLYTQKKLQPQNRKSKIEKMKFEDFFGRKLFYPTVAIFFMLIKKKPHMPFDRPKTNCRPKIENFHCYVRIFAVSKVDPFFKLTPRHSGGNDRFCARLKTDISAFSSGLQGHLRSCLTILDSSWRPLSKNVRHDLVRPLRPELEAEMSVFNLAQKRSFPPLCNATLEKKLFLEKIKNYFKKLF
jgi:hypothetical protein